MHSIKLFNKRLDPQVCTSVLRGVCLLAALTVNVAQAVVSQTPLFVAPQPNPNIMFTLDSSGSMGFDFLPDTQPDGRGWQSSFLNSNPQNDGYLTAQFRSSSINHLMYDPMLHYLPWQKSDGSYYPNADPTKAWDDPRNLAATTNLVDDTLCVQNGDGNGNAPECTSGNPTPVAQNYYAFYYAYNGGDIAKRKSYTRLKITPGWTGDPRGKGADRDDCPGVSCTYEQEIQNFANWYSYHRKRIFTAIAGVSQAFNPLDGNQRVGIGQIFKWYCHAHCDDAKKAVWTHLPLAVDGINNDAVVLGVRDFKGTDRDNFYAQLFSTQVQNGTPLRRAMDDVGQYFSRTDSKGPWAENPGVSKGTEYACRKTFHILMTDGYWNGEDSYTDGTHDADSVDGPVITNPKDNTTYQYKAASAGGYYNSSYKNTLSDVAMYYWNHDLRPDLADYVPTSTNDPAFWQHIVQYTVGLGVNGTLDYPGDTAALKDGSKTWPDVGMGDNQEAVDDLWHAAVNGRGLYFSAKNPKSFRDGLTTALADIGAQAGAAATVAINFDRTGTTGALAYAPSFESGTWLGHLLAFPVDAAGVVGTVKSWDAAELLPPWSERNIVTWNPDTSKAVVFDYANLSVAQKAAVGSSDVVDYLKGNAAKERAQSGPYRNRKNKLGDIVDSSPLYVRQLDFGYQALSGSASGGASYRDFFKGNATRKPMLYVGAGDGMLHAFDATTGVETFAYVPNSVYPNLKSLTDPTYVHKYFVDGQLTQADAYQLDGVTATSGAWKTLLIGSTGAGAKSVFALDVTNPTLLNVPALGVSNVKWERSSSGDDDMGYMLGKAEVVRLRNGKWAAIYGNGYESANKQAVLYVVDAFTGQTISGLTSDRISTGYGGTAIPNGLSTPAFVFNSARELMTAYAGDLQGNVWKFDFDENGNGSVSFVTKPLFTAKDKDGTPQPIVQRPALGSHPLGGYMVMFGTGKYFEVGDGATTQVQTAYGIWDKPGADNITDVRTTALQVQTLTAQAGGASLTTTTVDFKTKRGWFVDMALVGGSRAVGDPYVNDETTLFMTALTPVATVCVSGGKSQLYAFDYLSGGASSVFASGTDTSGTVLSVIDIAATLKSPRVVTVPPPAQTTAHCGGSGEPACTCGGHGQPACTCGGDGQPLCTPSTTGPDDGKCSSSKIIINQLDGGVSERSLNGQCKPPLRAWHQLNINY